MNETIKALVQLEADARVVANLRTLDAWERKALGNRYVTGGVGLSRVCVRLLVDGGELHSVWADDHDAARHAAAEWVRSQKP